MKDIHIGLIGFGTIGAGVVKTLLKNNALLEERLGFPLVLKGIADLDITTDRGIDVPDGVLTTNAEKLINDPNIDIIVELVGGMEPAKTFILKALEAGKHVVTANKALLAKQGNDLFYTAHRYNKDLYYEAAVGGGIPIIKTIREALITNNYTFIYSILNGTCNYILTEMTNNALSFNEAMDKAISLGYAEADPTFDIQGIDAGHKLTLIASLAYGIAPDMDSVYVEGISKLEQQDIIFASELGYKIKLLALAIDHGDRVEARLHPTLIPFKYLLSKVDGVFNAFYVRGDIVGSTFYYGHGAGEMPTASAVVGDIADIARNIQSNIAGRVPHLGYIKDTSNTKHFMPIEDIVTNYYLRINVVDKPGVLAKITGILGRGNISILSVIQKPQQGENHIPFVMLTHEAKETNIKKAIRDISALDEVRGEPVMIRVEDKDIKNKA
ncbi:MAG: homoserine dehydrogenase [Thermodesulfobacteriota bacterium]|nr:homoserine dehydrogenase [Thermodesulfobacteriota bacterium]